MKLQPDSNQALFTISAQGPGFVEINRVRYLQGVCLASDTAPEPWGCDGFAALTAADFERLLALQPEIVIIGTGHRQRFPHPSLLQALISQGVGFESMNTAAACRTYNILATEGRRVVAALVVDPRDATVDADL
ncbi:MAG: Xcc1710-like domain-containing protein [Proteobacteria bacterium]|nr:Xcc1710-like domain-containing protein [Pseudomonadota bacterium]